MTSENPSLNFRKDINGLRALAVLIVLFFHLEISRMPGGFLGVDVFLVISGYLISKSILTALQDSNFNLFNFYAKRFKRLSPALFFTIATSLIVGYLTLTPSNFENLGRAAGSCVLFFSNIFYLSETGYFNTESSLKPLLHIWSLSLEEQFYFIWPLLLFILFKTLKNMLPIAIGVFAILGLWYAHASQIEFPEKTFFLLPFRFFEFLLGAVCIWIEKFKLIRSFIKELLLLLGLAAITYSAVFFNGKTPMPGLLSLVPCGGAMLIICANNPKYTGFIFRNKVAEIIGKASYSIYLAHWPIIVYYKIYTLSELTLKSSFVLGFVSIVVGIVMWQLIESPFRKTSKKLFKLDLVWLWMPLVMYALYSFSSRIVLLKGMPERYSTEFMMTDAEIQANREKYWLGANTEKAVLKGAGNKKLALFGNSFSIDLIYALRKNGLSADIISVQTTHRCYNFSKTALVKEDEIFCSEINNAAFTDTSWLKASTIYLFDHWPKYEPAGLEQILLKIRSKTKVPIYVFGPKMVFKRPVPDIVHACSSASAFAINKFAQSYADKAERIAVNNLLLAFFKEPKWKQNNIYFIDVLLATGGTEFQFDVISRQNSKFLYFDPSHFTDQGALEFGQKLKKIYPELFDER